MFQTMQSHCIKVFAKKVPESEMRESFSLIHEKFTSSTEGVLDDMSTYAKKNILTVPPNIVLPGMVNISFLRLKLNKNLRGKLQILQILP